MPEERATKDKKEKYNEEVKKVKKEMEKINRDINVLMRDTLKKDKSAIYKKIAIANKYLDLALYNCKLNRISEYYLGIKNDAFLNEARKEVYKAITTMESIVGTEIDIPLTEKYEILKGLHLFNPYRLLHFFKKMELVLEIVEEEFGKESKWKWTFVELYARFAVLLKNFINYRQVMAAKDPRKPFFKELMELIKYVKEALKTSAQKYREKYELDGQKPPDMKKAIELMRALMRIQIIMKEDAEVQETKKIIDKWNQKLEEDIKAKEEKEKRKSAEGG